MGIGDALGTVGTDLLGPSYNYAQKIKTPTQIGLSGVGGLDQLSTDVSALIEYVEVLVSGPSNALKNPLQPLGNKFFLKTMGKCKDRVSGSSEDRYIYVNNIPTGNIPFLSAVAGTDLSEFRGLAPGILTNLNALNPIALVQSMFVGPDPECAEVTWPIVGNDGTSTDTHHILVDDIQMMDPCDVSETYTKPDWGYDAKNVFDTNPQSCTMGFQNRKLPGKFVSNESNELNESNESKSDMFNEVYFTILGLLGLFILLKLMHKTR